MLLAIFFRTRALQPGFSTAPQSVMVYASAICEMPKTLNSGVHLTGKRSSGRRNLQNTEKNVDRNFRHVCSITFFASCRVLL